MFPTALKVLYKNSGRWNKRNIRSLQGFLCKTLSSFSGSHFSVFFHYHIAEMSVAEAFLCVLSHADLKDSGWESIYEILVSLGL